VASIERTGFGGRACARLSVALRVSLLALPAFAAVPAAFPQAGEPGGALMIRSLKFEGNESFQEPILAASIATTNSSWFARSGLVRWIGFGTVRYLSERELRVDIRRLKLFYAIHGFLEARIDTTVVRTEREAHITFTIQEGEPLRVTSFQLLGLDSLERPGELLNDLPLRPGDIYDRVLFLASADTISLRMQDRGYPWVRVFRRQEVDSAQRRAVVSLLVEPGRLASIGAVRVTGTNAVDSSFVREKLATEPGRTYSGKDLSDSRLRLYRSDLFRYVSVEPDSAAIPSDSATVPLLVSVTEGPLYRVRAASGYGTDDCFRLGVGWLSRNAFGRGQAFEVSGQLSKLGVGDPTSFGPTRDFLCGRLSEDSLGSGKVNYAAAVSLRRPVFISPSNALTVALFAERRSEFGVYRREDVGGSVTLTRETAARVPVSLTYRLSYGATEAQPVSFCAFFNACTEDDIAQLRERRLIAVMTLGIQKASLNNPLDPLRGSAFSFEVAHSSRIVGSSEFARFTRLVGDAVWYYPIGRMVVAAHARVGAVLAPQLSLEAGAGNFVPPEQRFYAGGANDVRGFRRNELGPIVYTVPVVDSTIDRYRDSTVAIADDSLGFSPTGANTLIVGNLELRVPSPVFANQVRLGFFVDAGAVWDRGTDRPVGAQLRITPGMGIRYTTPLGPGRLDVAYNGYARPVGRLYGLREGTREVELLRERFQPSERGSKFVLQLSIGHAF